MRHENTLVIGDPHAPFTHRDYLEFCRSVQRDYKCTRVVCVGDLVDQHAISYHEHNPDGMSAGDEWKAAVKQLKKWYKAFPRVRSCIGNHDALIHRKAHTAGIPVAFLRSFKDIYEAPAGWEFDFSFKFGNWRLTHGTNTSGHDAAFKAALSARESTAQGHIHTAANTKFHACDKDIIWGMQVGWGGDRRAYAFAYGRDFKDKPIVSCGVVTNGGKLPIVIPMPL